ncbi:hypothetical protein GQ44DRAFT_830467 [Phaeosphaeriaceae sp. PMI808]|nr:hypothetical protein GQ44DRAFT_830467 [Phaeosphaeriaceae sp. PMI808]
MPLTSARLRVAKARRKEEAATTKEEEKERKEKQRARRAASIHASPRASLAAPSQPRLIHITYSYDKVPRGELLPAVFTVPENEQQDYTHPKAPQVHVHAPLHEARWWTRLIPYLIVVPTIISIVIGSLQLRKYADSKGKLYEWSVTSRGLVQVFIRNRLTERDVNLNTVKLWSAFTQARTEWNLPWTLALVSLIFFTITYVPAALWAGALTPSFTLKSIDHGLSLLSSGLSGNYSFLYPDAPLDVPVAFSDCWAVQQSNGTFTNCPLKYNTGNLLRTVATASSLHSTPRNHSKWTDDKLQYIGRPYGVGAAIGLTDTHLKNLHNIQTYAYHEPGFVASTTCIYNASADMTIKLYHAPNDATYPNLFLARGALPNSDWTRIYETKGASGYTFYAQTQLQDTVGTGIVSIFSHGSPGNSERYMFGIVAGSLYPRLNKVQCEITFKRSDFFVETSVSRGTITVTPTSNSVDGEFDKSGNLRSRAMGQYYLPFVIRLGASPDKKPGNDTVLAAVADSVTAFMDDALVAFGGAALTFPNATSKVDVTASIAAVQIGSAPFIIAVVVVNFLGLIVVLVGQFMLRSASVPSFDYNDLECMVLGIVQGMGRMNEMQEGKNGGSNGSPKHPTIGGYAVRLKADGMGGNPAVLLR